MGQIICVHILLPITHISISFISNSVYHDSINFTHTLLFIFRFKNCFQNLFFYHELPSTLYNQNLYRADKLHLTTKGNDILVRWLHHCITRLTQPTQNQTHSPCPLCKMFPLLLSSQILIGLPYLPHHNPPNQLYSHTDTANKA